MERDLMVTWFTTLGWRPLAAINTIWEHCIETTTFPDKIIIFKHDSPDVNKNVDEVKRLLARIKDCCKPSPKMNVEFVSLETETIEEYASTTNAHITECLQDPSVEIIVDITPGRKFMSIILANIALDNKDRIKIAYYNHLYKSDTFDVLLPLVPVTDYDVINILDQSRFLVQGDDQARLEETEDKTRREKTFEKRAVKYDKFRQKVPETSKLDDVHITLVHMNLILNELALLKAEFFTIEYTPLGQEVANFQMGDKINLQVQKSFNIPEIIPESVASELPAKKNCWMDLLKMGGIVKPKNLKNLKAEIDKSQQFEPLKGEPPTALCMDTNLFRNRMYTFLTHEFFPNPRDQRPGFILPEKVQDELSAFDRKLKDDDVGEFASLAENTFP